MPNHVTNEITILGTPEEVAEIKKFMKSDECPFDFENLTPMPKEESENWYNWRCNNWGSKWNSYSHHGFDDDTDPYIGFQTAWSHPIPILEALSIKFPTIKFEVRFADEDFGFNVGSYEILDGLIENENFPEGGSTEAYELAMDIQGNEDYYLYDMFVDGWGFDEDEPRDLEEFEEKMLEKSVRLGYVDAEFPQWVLEIALQIAIDEELFERAETIKDAMDKKVEK